MILCDIGNRNFHFWEDGRIWNVPIDKPLKNIKNKMIYFASVNDEGTNILKSMVRTLDLEKYATLDTGYRGMGIDRVLACVTIDDGIVVDAGSAITVDIMQNGIHIGGCILPGLFSYQSMFASISKKLDKKLSFGIDTKALPSNTTDAMSYGVIQSIKPLITDVGKNKHIRFCGADGKFLSRLFDKGIYDGTMIFRGMKKVIEINGLAKYDK
jgi:type III pantothenate kinase